MIPILIVDENVLQVVAKCPLMAANIKPEPVYNTALDTLRWALIREFREDPVPIAALRERFGFRWKELYYSEYKQVSPPPDHLTYWAGLRKAAPVARHIRDFLRRYKVLLPSFPYSLQIDDACIKGSYALVQSRRGEARTFVLVEHAYRPRYHDCQDMLALARWYAASQPVHEHPLGIYHLPLLRDDGWLQFPQSESLVRHWLSGIMNTVLSARYPSPGSHCQDCIGQPCLEVFRERPAADHR